MNNFRKPGAQPGNRNAYKHGFYSKAISTLEGTDPLLSMERNF
jgi:hypothetical protein